MPTIQNICDSLPHSALADYETRPAPATQTVVHHSATRDTVMPTAIARYHVESRGWPGIGYHYVVDAVGTIWQTNPESVVSYHAGQANEESIGVCLIGNFMEQEPPQVQLDATRWLLRQIGLPVIGHKEAPGAQTACPGDTWDDWRREIEPEGRMISKLNGVFTQTQPERSRDPNNPLLADIIAASPMTAAKAIDPHTWPEPLTTMWPNVKRGYARFWRGEDAEDHALMQMGKSGAEIYFYDLEARYEQALSMGWTDITGPNEPHPSLWPDPHRATEFWLRWIELIVALGARPWVGQFGVGWPADNMAPVYADAIAAATEAGGGLELHEYGYESIRSDEPWKFGRHQQTVAELRSVGVEPRVMIGELGITRATHPGEPDVGWKSFTSWVYPPMFGLGQQTMDHELWWRMVSDADDAYCQFDYITDAFMFLTYPRPEWATHDWGEWHVRRQIQKLESAGPVPEEQQLQELALACQETVIPYTPGTALRAEALKHRLYAVSDEHRKHGKVGQSFRHPGEPGQIMLWCEDGDWGNVQMHEVEGQR